MKASVIGLACLLASALVGASCGSRVSSAALQAADQSGAAVKASPGADANGNVVSDTGVSSTEIRVGLVVSKSSVLGAETFSGPMYGAQAFVQALNNRGGIHGRTVQLIVCDDGGTGVGNRRCVSQLIDHDKVFAFAGNSIFDYAGAPLVNQREVPDVGGQPISNAYEQYRHLFEIYGSSSPRDGQIGFNGKLYGGTEVYRYFKEALGSKVAGVVYYNQSDSERYANLTVSGLTLEGYQVVREQVDFSLPNFDAAAIDMRSHHVDTVFDVLDSTGNVRLCKAMDGAQLTVKAKVSTVQSWNETLRTDYVGATQCRNSVYATGNDRNYMDTNYPSVARFRADMLAAFPDREGKLSMWELEGWASAQWLADAIGTCPAAPTRSCVEKYLNRPAEYDGHGLLTPRNFAVAQPGAPQHNCLNVAQWQDSAYGGKGGWVTRVPDMMTNCFDVPSVAYAP